MSFSFFDILKAAGNVGGVVLRSTTSGLGPSRPVREGCKEERTEKKVPCPKVKRPRSYGSLRIRRK